MPSADEFLSHLFDVGAKKAYARYPAARFYLGAVHAVELPALAGLCASLCLSPMAGNVGLLKHASNVLESALYLDTLFERGAFPASAQFASS